MRHASLFSGIGGFDLAAEWMGWENVFQCEIDPFCQAVLTKNFPQTKRYGDIKQFDATPYRGAIDILTGGFPCQPYSSAGKRKGTEDARHLWPEMLRIIGEVQPMWIVGENVSGLLNWSGGLVLKQIKTDLEDKGFIMLPPAVLPACGINAPHRRDRVWIIAHSKGCDDRRNEREISGTNGRPEQYDISTFEKSGSGLCEKGIIANSSSHIIQGRQNHRSPSEVRQNGKEQPLRLFPPGFAEFPTKPAICRGNDGIPNRMDRIKSLGNAIVPQVAFEIFKAIEKLNLCTPAQYATEQGK
jgi:DNA (cytosine-5)-methyltransferase 1